jgi:DNA ligase D-like protein (predicted 3'-phosphoesterase)
MRGSRTAIAFSTSCVLYVSVAGRASSTLRSDVDNRVMGDASEHADKRAIRASVSGHVQGVGFREAALRRAQALGVMGWVRNAHDGMVAVHAEGAREATESLIAFLRAGPRGAAVASVEVEEVRAEGHEQFAIRGVSAGAFLVREHAASNRHFDFRLEVGGTMRSWALPKGPSLDPAVKRFAIEVPDHDREAEPFEGSGEGGGVIVWDRGRYEQGGRVPWPAALERGHAVFVLHGEKLRGGFALQRTSAGEGAKAQWLLIKRRDEHACPGSDVAREMPASVLSGRTLDELMRDG